ncbi:hypothetical protein PsorP6_007468 [Peronosclerospora sorghi]|uniref:Uncharacterized protein n=1 Tax=Peronosclerospora sorghi TaxID=230839 RepID=A0ACC0W9L9_9STRA|nr:hypothetical protein PsorP6_007468 [Peronosclerospora sorghi]
MPRFTLLRRPIFLQLRLLQATLFPLTSKASWPLMASRSTSMGSIILPAACMGVCYLVTNWLLFKKRILSSKNLSKLTNISFSLRISGARYCTAQACTPQLVNRYLLLKRTLNDELVYIHVVYAPDERVNAANSFELYLRFSMMTLHFLISKTTTITTPQPCHGRLQRDP